MGIGTGRCGCGTGRGGLARGGSCDMGLKTRSRKVIVSRLSRYLLPRTVLEIEVFQGM